MKKKGATKNPVSISRSLGPLIEQVRTLVQSARQAAATSVNAFQERSPQIWQKPSGKLAAMSPDHLLAGLDFFFTSEGAEYTDHDRQIRNSNFAIRNVQPSCPPCFRWCKKVVSR